MIPGLDHLNNEAQSFENTIYVGIVSDFKFVKSQFDYANSYSKIYFHDNQRSKWVSLAKKIKLQFVDTITYLKNLRSFCKITIKADNFY